jgi:hypothetical protein
MYTTLNDKFTLTNRQAQQLRRARQLLAQARAALQTAINENGAAADYSLDLAVSNVVGQVDNASVALSAIQGGDA